MKLKVGSFLVVLVGSLSMTGFADQGGDTIDSPEGPLPLIDVTNDNPIHAGQFQAYLLAPHSSRLRVDSRTADCYAKQISLMKSWQSDPSLSQLVQKLDSIYPAYQKIKQDGLYPSTVEVVWSLDAVTNSKRFFDAPWSPSNYGDLSKSLQLANEGDWSQIGISSGSVILRAGYDFSSKKCQLTSADDLKNALKVVLDQEIPVAAQGQKLIDAEKAEEAKKAAADDARQKAQDEYENEIHGAEGSHG